MVYTGIPGNYLIAIKGAVLITFLIVLLSFVKAWQKRERTKIIIRVLILIPMMLASYVVFGLRLKSLEFDRDFKRRRKITFERGEQIIAAIKIYNTRLNKYPDSLYSLTVVRRDIKLKDGWGRAYVYKKHGPTYRLSFKLPHDDGYYFYNSATGTLRFQGHLFKYMHDDIVR